jgi:predicted small lipoprotein YifL
MMQFFSRLSLLTLAMLSLSACGQKGPLFLPDKPAAISTPYPTTTPKENSETGEN